MKTFSKTTRIRITLLTALLATCPPNFARAADRPARPTLNGTVKNHSGEPLPGATVFIYTAGPKEGPGILCPSCYNDCRKRAQADVQGNFAIDSLDPALLFRILVVAKGFQPEFFAAIDPAEKPVEVILNPIVGGDAPNKRMRGIVVDPQGQPVSGAVVSIRGVTRGGTTRYGGNRDIDAMAVSDDSGAFVINGQESF